MTIEGGLNIQAYPGVILPRTSPSCNLSKKGTFQQPVKKFTERKT